VRVLNGNLCEAESFSDRLGFRYTQIQLYLGAVLTNVRLGAKLMKDLLFFYSKITLLVSLL